MCNLHIKETEISQKRSKGIKNYFKSSFKKDKLDFRVQFFKSNSESPFFINSKVTISSSFHFWSTRKTENYGEKLNRRRSGNLG